MTLQTPSIYIVEDEFLIISTIETALRKQGYTIVQDPSTCDVDAMPKAALQLFEPDLVLSPEGIIEFLNNL